MLDTRKGTPMESRDSAAEDSALSFYEAFTQAYSRLQEISRILSLREIETYEDFKRFEELTLSLDEPYAVLRKTMFGEGNPYAQISTATLVEMSLDTGKSLADSPVWQGYDRFFASYVAKNPPIEESQKSVLLPLYDVCAFVFQDSLFKELWRRQDQNEDKSGRVVRDFLVNRDVDPRALASLVSLVLWRTPQIPGDPEESESITRFRITEESREYLSMKVVGLDPRGLEALVEGRFNRTGWIVHEKVRTELRAEYRRIDRNAGDAPLEMMKASNIEAQDDFVNRKIILEKLAQSLPPRAKEFLEIRLRVDTDAEAAAEMGITPAAASKHRNRIENRLRDMLKSTPL